VAWDGNMSTSWVGACRGCRIPDAGSVLRVGDAALRDETYERFRSSVGAPIAIHLSFFRRIQGEGMAKNFAFINAAAKKAYMSLPEDIRNQFGLDIHAVQHGLKPFSDSEDVSASVGRGSFELKQNGSPAHRAIYCAKFLDTVYVLHAFSKTTNAVDRQAMKTAEGRYKLLLEENQAAVKANKKAPKKGASAKKTQK